MSEKKIPKNKYPMSGKIEYDYNYKPKTTIVINYFTSVDTMLKTINNLRCLGDEVEFVVANDRHGENTEQIMKTLTHRNDRMIISHDLDEQFGYNHGAQISNASDYLIFFQDDDLAPENNQWYLDCLKEFDKDPELGVIGLLKGGYNYGSKIPGFKRMGFMDEYEKLYVSWLAFGPIMVRKDLYFKVGGFSPEFGQIGECSGVTDADFTTKIFLEGYKAMLLRTPSVRQWIRRFERGNNGLVGSSVQEFGNYGPRVSRIHLNVSIYYEKYKEKQKEITSIVRKQNLELLGIKIKEC